MKRYFAIIGLLVVIISSLLVLNFSFQKTLRAESAEQFNHQQLLLAKTEASRVEGYLSVIKEDLLHVIQLAAKMDVPRESDFRLLTDSVCRHIGDIKRRVVFLDPEGKVRYTRGTMPIQETDDRFFLDAVKEGCQSDVRIQQDVKRVYMSGPVCRSGSLAGALLIFLDIQDLTTMFLSPIKLGSNGYAWMIDQNGYLLYHPTQPDMVGRNLYKTDSSCFQCHNSFEVEKEIIEGRGDFSGRYIAPSGEDKILAFSTMAAGNTKWFVAVSSPYSEVTMHIKKSMGFYNWGNVLIFLFTVSASALLLFFHRKRVKAEEVQRHEKELEKYAEELEQNVAERTKELTAEKEKLNTIVSTVGGGIVLLGTDGTIQWINQTMKEIAGKDITGMSYKDICTDCTIINSYTSNNVETVLLKNLFGRKDCQFQISTAPIKSESGEVRGYIRLVQDVTGIKKMEEQMIHSEKLAYVERLTSGIAQEIGSPLTSVFSFIEMLKGMERDEFKKETLETIYLHMKSISSSLQTLSSFSKVPPPELRPWKVNSLIELALSLIQYDKRAKDVTIVRDFISDIPEITTDGYQLSQVIVNIILNAVDTMPEGGTLTIRSRVNEGNVRIDFEDTGVGIPKERLEGMFDPLYSSKEHETGLGLAVSHNIIKKLNGSITAESEVNKGSRFVITLPVDGTTRG